MASVTRSTTNPTKPAAVVKAPAKKGMATSLNLSLPLELSQPSHDINDYHFLIHGEKKIGKTTIATVEDNVFLLTFDPLQKAYSIRQRHVPSWAHFMEYLKLLEDTAKTGKYPYKRVVVDGVDIWHRQCQTWCEKKLVIDHIQDEEFGKGWDLLKYQFSTAIDRLLALPGGCWFVSHSHWREVLTRNKIKINKLLPLMKSGAEEALVGRVDGWFAYDYDGKERILVIMGDESTGAGHRIKGHFLTPKGRRIQEIPMGSDEHEAYANLLKAFNNQQTFISVHERNEIAKKKTVVKPVVGGTNAK